MNLRALPWERAAFIRARAAAGDIALGQRFLDAIQPFVWRRSLDFGVIEEVRQISARIRDHFAQNAQIGPGYDLKRGRGGIREVEFFVQIQQMIHGGRDPSVRVPATLDAIQALLAADRLDEETANGLAETYRLLRTIEHRVQMVEDAQTHLLPAEPAALDNVARLYGLKSGDDLLDFLRPHVDQAGGDLRQPGARRARAIVQRPRHPEARAEPVGLRRPRARGPRTSPTGARARRARSARRPRSRRSKRCFRGCSQAIAAGADPNHALNRLSDIVERLSSGVNLFRLLEARPPLARLLAKVLAHAPALADQLARRPELFEGLFDASSFAMPPPASEFAGLAQRSDEGPAL